MVLKTVRRLVIFVIGITVLLLGVILLVTPGPAFVVIPVGLAILATEFVWASRLLGRMKQGATDVADSFRRRTRRNGPAPSVTSGGTEREPAQETR